MLRRALLLKVVSWIVLSPAYAVAQPPQPLHCRSEVCETMTQRLANSTMVWYK